MIPVGYLGRLPKGEVLVQGKFVFHWARLLLPAHILERPQAVSLFVKRLDEVGKVLHVLPYALP